MTGITRYVNHIETADGWVALPRLAPMLASVGWDKDIGRVCIGS